MHWEWIVPVVVFAVWILLSLIRNTEDQRDPRQRQQPGGGRAPERPSSDVEKFLEEINRMRRKAVQGEEARAEPVRPTPPPEAIPVELSAAPNFEKPKPV